MKKREERTHKEIMDDIKNAELKELEETGRTWFVHLRGSKDFNGKKYYYNMSFKTRPEAKKFKEFMSHNNVETHIVEGTVKGKKAHHTYFRGRVFTFFPPTTHYRD